MTIRRRHRRDKPAARQNVGYLLIAPAVVVSAVFLLWPALRTAYISCTDWNLLSDPQWVGLDNYRDLLRDEEFRHSVIVTIGYVGGVTLTTISVAFLLAVALTAVGGRLGRVFSSIFFLPVMLSTVIASSLFISVFNPYGGVLRLLPLPFGLSNENWYQSSELVLPALVIFTLWKGVGLYVVIFFAALKDMPAEQIEAAKMDGARRLQILRDIVVPMLRPIFLFAVVVCIIFSFQNFAIVYTSTQGGPAGASEILPILIYQSGFKESALGQASATAMMMFVVVGAFSILQFRLLRDRNV